MVALSHPEPEKQTSQDMPDQKLPAQGGLLSDMQSMEEVGQLVMNMSQAGQHGDIFKIFAEHVTQLVPGLTHISVLLLPAAQPRSTTTAGTETLGPLNKGKPSAKSSLTTRLEWQQYMGGTKSSKAEAGKKVEPDLLTWPYADLQTGSELPVLDWRSCKDLLITLKKGVDMKHPTPAYPVSCTAACYVARTHAESVTTPDYLQDGPHFADWGGMQEQGAVSMASAPIHMSNEVVAVLTLASSQQAAFEESKAKLVWVLSFVLAPYTHILSQTTHKTDAHRFIENVMPRLLEQSHSQQAAAVQLSSGRDMLSNADHDSHTEPLCSVCRMASKTTNSPSKQGDRGRVRKSGIFPAELEANSTAASVGHTHMSGQTSGRSFQADNHLAPPDCALDWGDFFFNLVSMCIMYAHFNKATAAGEGTVAVVLSISIAAVDVILLTVRWLWYEHFLMHGDRTCRVFNLYRLIVLPVANTWMSWSLLHKLHWDPTPHLLAGLGFLMTLFLIIGLKVRFFLHAPLQLATVLLAAATAQHMCTALQTSTSGAACLSLISVQQLVLGLLIPSFLTFMLDFRVGTAYMPHIQAKSWAVIPS